MNWGPLAVLRHGNTHIMEVKLEVADGGGERRIVAAWYHSPTTEMVDDDKKRLS